MCPWNVGGKVIQHIGKSMAKGEQQMKVNLPWNIIGRKTSQNVLSSERKLK